MIDFRLISIGFRFYVVFTFFINIQGGPPRNVNGAERRYSYVAGQAPTKPPVAGGWSYSVPLMGLGT